MKRKLKILFIIILAIICLFSIYIIEESIRLKSNNNAKPLIILDQSKYCISCMDNGEERDYEYWSLGYKLKVRYLLSEESTDDLKIVNVIGKEFKLFNKFRLWAWIS